MISGPERMDKTGKVDGAFTDLKRRQDRERVVAIEPRVGRYRTLVIDPPWDYGSGTGKHVLDYATMKQPDLLAMPTRR
jgi:hypothetical protein